MSANVVSEQELEDLGLSILIGEAKQENDNLSVEQFKKGLSERRGK